jgi:hypothetical protein
MYQLTTFKFLFECECDYINVIKNFRKHYEVSNVNIQPSEIEFSITGQVELKHLVELVRECDDCHYIEETINEINKYTGIRTYGLREDGL